MHPAASINQLQGPSLAPSASELIECRVWLPEFNWLHHVATSDLNVAPAFRLPDLLGACVSLILQHSDDANRIFGYLHTHLMHRSADTPRRRVDLWPSHHEQLAQIQRSSINQYPHPRFQMDQLTTACVALVCLDDPEGASVLRRCRLNLSLRNQ